MGHHERLHIAKILGTKETFHLFPYFEHCLQTMVMPNAAGSTAVNSASADGGGADVATETTGAGAGGTATATAASGGAAGATGGAASASVSTPATSTSPAVAAVAAAAQPVAATAEVHTALFKCLATWLAFKGAFACAINTSPLLPAMFESCIAADSALAEAASEATINACLLAESPHHPGLRELIAEATLALLVPHLKLRLAALPSEIGAGEEEELLAPTTRLAKIVAHCGDLMVKPMVDELANPGGLSAVTIAVFDALDAISSATEHWNVFKMAVFFWALVADKVAEKVGGVGAEIAEKIKPAYLQFVNQLVDVRFHSNDAGDDGGGDGDGDDDDTAAQLTEAIQATCSLVDPEGIVAHCWGLMLEVGQAKDGSAMSEDEVWWRTEAIVFMVSKVAETSSMLGGTEHGANAEDAVFSFVQWMARVPPTATVHLKIRAVELAGCMGKWAVFQTVVSGEGQIKLVHFLCDFILEHSQTAGGLVVPAGIIAVADLCKHQKCKIQLGARLPIFMGIVQGAEALGLNQLQQIRMTRSATQVAVALEPSQRLPAVQLIWGTLKGRLDQALKACCDLKPGSGATAAALATPLFVELDDVVRILCKGLCTPLKTLNVSNDGDFLAQITATVGVPVRQYMKTILAFACFPSADVPDCFKQFSESLAESANLCLLRLFRALGSRALPFLQETIGEAVAIFETHHHASCVYLVGKLLDLYGNLPAYAEPFITVVSVFAQHMTTLLADVDAMDARPHLTDDYSIMLYTVITTAERAEAEESGFRDLVLRSGFLETLVRFCIVALTSKQKTSVHRVTDVLSAFIEWHNREDALFKKAVAEHVLPVAQELVHSLMKAMALTPALKDSEMAGPDKMLSAVLLSLGKVILVEENGSQRKLQGVNLAATAAGGVAEPAPVPKATATALLRAVLSGPEFSCPRVTEALKSKLCKQFETNRYRPDLDGDATTAGIRNLARIRAFHEEMCIFSRLYRTSTSVALEGDDGSGDV